VWTSHYKPGQPAYKHVAHRYTSIFLKYIFSKNLTNHMATIITLQLLKDISPLCPHLPNISQLSDTSIFLEIQTHLWLLRASLECYEKEHDETERLTSWLLYIYPITYTSSAEKENWRTVPDMFSFCCFSDLWKEKLEWQNSRIGVFCTKAEN
jgi:hypothetical protein